MYVAFTIVVAVALALDFLLIFLFNKSRNLVAQLLIILGEVLIALILIPILNILEIGCVSQIGFGPGADLCGEEYKRKFTDPTILYFLFFPFIMLVLKKIPHGIYIMFFLFLIFLLIAHMVSLKPIVDSIFYTFHLFFL